MYIFGHLGFGATATHWLVSRKLNHQSTKYEASTLLFGWALIGCLLPDLLDKPLYILNRTLELNIPGIIGDKSIAHSILFCSLIFTYSLFRKNPLLLSISIGTFSHLCLDLFADSSVWWIYGTAGSIPPYSFSSPKLNGYFWPLLTTEFAPSSQESFNDYWVGLLKPILLGYEIIGVLLLIHMSIKVKFSPLRWLNYVIKLK